MELGLEVFCELSFLCEVPANGVLGFPLLFRANQALVVLQTKVDLQVLTHVAFLVLLKHGTQKACISNAF